MLHAIEVWQAARVWFKRYGADAPLQAAQRSDDVLEAGDLDGRAVWLLIHAAVVELLRDAPRED
jgi:hypothetical protein